MKKLTQEEFIKRAKEIHGNKYDYSATVYENCRKKVIIICPEHGPFDIWPMDHLRGVGCSRCFDIYKRGKNRQKASKEKFIEKARKIHGDKYDYSKVVYENNKKEVCIICPEHGEFWQTPRNHIHNAAGCPICRESKLEKETRKQLKVKKIKFEYQKRFNWLGYQSLDFYLPDYNVGIECQGIQHFEPVDFSGKGNAEEQFKEVKRLDKKKKELCEEKNVTLKYINYNDDVKEKIDNILEEMK